MNWTNNYRTFTSLDAISDAGPSDKELRRHESLIFDLTYNDPTGRLDGHSIDELVELAAAARVKAANDRAHYALDLLLRGRGLLTYHSTSARDVHRFSRTIVARINAEIDNRIALLSADLKKLKKAKK